MKQVSTDTDHVLRQGSRTLYLRVLFPRHGSRSAGDPSESVGAGDKSATQTVVGTTQRDKNDRIDPFAARKCGGVLQAGDGRRFMCDLSEGHG